MGKRILVRRRGRGGIVFRARTHRRVAATSYPPITDLEYGSTIRGFVRDLMHDPARGTPIAFLKFDNGQKCYVPAPEGLGVRQEVWRGIATSTEIGNIMPLGKIPEGTLVSSIELKPGDGGRIAKSSGSYAMVVAHTPRGTEMKLPSGRSIYLDDRCRAMIGVVAGAGRAEKPFMKAGTRKFLLKARGRKWPLVKGMAMVAASHPYGGGRHKRAGKPTTVSRQAPPGRKVGLIAARQTGRAVKRRTPL